MSNLSSNEKFLLAAHLVARVIDVQHNQSYDVFKLQFIILLLMMCAMMYAPGAQGGYISMASGS